MRKADNLPPYCAVVKKSRSLNFLDPSGPAMACNGCALPLPLCVCIIRSYGPFLIMKYCITICQLRTEVKQHSVGITVCIFADKTLHGYLSNDTADFEYSLVRYTVVDKHRNYVYVWGKYQRDENCHIFLLNFQQTSHEYTESILPIHPLL